MEKKTVKKLSWSNLPILPPSIDSPLAYAPCLVRLRDNVCEFYQPAYGAAYKLVTPEIHGARIRSSGYGWLLLTQNFGNDDDDKIFFFNPFTKDKIYLPYCRCVNMVALTFSSPPTSQECLVIGINHVGMGLFTSIMTIRRGDNSWKCHSFIRDEDCYEKYGYYKRSFECHNSSPVIYDGKCYFLGESCNIGMFDLERNTWHVYGDAWPAGLTRPVSLVLEKDGGLLAVFTSREHRQVRMCRFNFLKMAWEDVESIEDDKILYLSEEGTSFLETSVASHMGNKIHFSLFNEEEVGIFYSLSTKKYHSFDGKYCSKYPFNLSVLQSSTWIKPDYTPTDNVEGLKWCKEHQVSL